MKITARKINSPSFAKFTWNDELDDCHHVALGVSDEDFDLLIENKVHEGANLEGWVVEIEW